MKQIKTKVLNHELSIPWDAVVHTPDAVTWMVQDKITIIGAQMQAHCGLGSNPALTEGEAAVLAILSRAPAYMNDGVIATAFSHPTYSTEIVVAQQIAVTTGPHISLETVMFPPNFGIDMDEGEYLHLHQLNYLSMLSAGSYKTWSYAVVYYVER